MSAQQGEHPIHPVQKREVSRPDVLILTDDGFGAVGPVELAAQMRRWAAASASMVKQFGAPGDEHDPF